MQTAPNDIKRMDQTHQVVRSGAVVGGLCLLGSVLGVATRDLLDAVLAPGPAALGDALTAVVGLVALVLLTGLLASTLLAALSRIPGVLGRAAARVDRRVTPRVLRHASGILLGATLGTMGLPSTGLAESGPRVVAAQAASGPAAAADPLTGQPQVGPPPAVGGAVVSGLPAPDPFRAARPAVRPQLAPDLLAGSRVAAPSGIVVHRGDTLWDIVARALGPDAGDLEVARAWPAWFAHNRHVIGDDPDLILPGQVLTRPPVAPDPVATRAGR